MKDDCGVVTVARIKGRKSERDDVPVKIDRITVNMARLIAAQRGTTVAALLSEMLQNPVKKAYAEMIRELEKGGSG